MLGKGKGRRRLQIDLENLDRFVRQVLDPADYVNFLAAGSFLTQAADTAKGVGEVHVAALEDKRTRGDNFT
ncbi:hypothetical protein D3C81_2214430 [compost metagenome]